MYVFYNTSSRSSYIDLKNILVYTRRLGKIDFQPCIYIKHIQILGQSVANVYESLLESTSGSSHLTATITSTEKKKKSSLTPHEHTLFFPNSASDSEPATSYRTTVCHFCLISQQPYAPWSRIKVLKEFSYLRRYPP